MRFSKGLIGILLALLIGGFTLTAIGSQVAIGTKGMVASAKELASEAGAQILASGGNAVDAAVATAFVLSVVEPYASGLGGEGYMVLSLADGRDRAIDYRSWAPGHVTIKTNPKPRIGPDSTCIPGTVAGLTYALKEYGTMSLAQVLAPAIRLAKEGFPVDKTFVDLLAAHEFYKNMLENPELAEAREIFLKDGLIPDVGTKMTNPQLAHALELLAAQGPDAFYRGEIAKAIVKATGGWITSADLQRYQAVDRDPITSKYRGYEIVGTPPNVAGIVVAEALNILNNFDLSKYKGWDDPGAIHLMAEALLLASADRYPYVGDPDFYALPMEGLLSEEYARDRAQLIDPNKVIPPREASAGDPYKYMPAASSTVPVGVGVLECVGSPSTTQISVVDKDGNAVSITQTLSYFWGSQVMVPGYGFLLNNELHNFNAYNPDNPNDLNVIEPYKRPRTVLAPTIVKDQSGRVFLVLGTPGAGRIPSTVVETIVNTIDFGLPLEEAIKAPKFCSRVAYKELRMESGYSDSTIAALKALGHKIKTYGTLDLYFGGINAVMWKPDGTMVGVGSFRRGGGAAGPE
jgi:gamma-glutamyltranspeptidase/glutathione hydrolase